MVLSSVDSDAENAKVGDQGYNSKHMMRIRFWWKLDSEKNETILLKKTWCCELMAIGIGSFLELLPTWLSDLVFCWFSAPKLQRPRPVPRERRRSVHNKSCTFGAWSDPSMVNSVRSLAYSNSTSAIYHVSVIGCNWIIPWLAHMVVLNWVVIAVL